MKRGEQLPSSTTVNNDDAMGGGLVTSPRERNTTAYAQGRKSVRQEQKKWVGQSWSHRGLFGVDRARHLAGVDA
jgi:hypothetical protein